MSHAVTDVVSQLTELPPFPRVTTKLLRLLDDSSASADDLAQVISADPSLSMHVIHIANSPFYMLSRPIQAVKDAVLVLGITTIKSITTAVSIQKGLRAVSPRPDIFDQDEFWKHSYATAFAARWLASKDNAQQADKHFLVGLIHDVGKLIQARFWPDSWMHVIQRMRMASYRYEEVERECFSTGHLDLLQQLCTNWEFPSEIIGMLAMGAPGHDEASPVDQTPIWRANWVAEACGYRFPLEDRRLEVPMTYLDGFEEIAEILPKEVDYQLQSLEV